MQIYISTTELETPNSLAKLYQDGYCCTISNGAILAIKKQAVQWYFKIIHRKQIFGLTKKSKEFALQKTRGDTMCTSLEYMRGEREVKNKEEDRRLYQNKIIFEYE